MSDERPVNDPVFCSFCAKSRREVKHLVAAERARAAICNECFMRCAEVLAQAMECHPEHVYGVVRQQLLRQSADRMEALRRAVSTEEIVEIRGASQAQPEGATLPDGGDDG